MTKEEKEAIVERVALAYIDAWKHGSSVLRSIDKSLSSAGIFEALESLEDACNGAIIDLPPMQDRAVAALKKVLGK